MKEFLKLILMGILIGLGKVIPGVSGSLIAVSLGIYERAIEAISHFFHDLKENILFLGFLAIGIILSIGCGSKIVLLCLEFFYFPTMLLFLGFITGILPNLLKKFSKKNIKNIYFFVGALLFVFLLNQIVIDKQFYPEYNLTSYLIIVGLGFLDAATMIIPGISGTAIFMILGCYSFILNLFSSVSTFTIIGNLPYFICFASGLLLGILAVSHFVHYMLKRYKDIMYSIILGFTCSSIYVLLDKTFQTEYSIYTLVIGVVLFMISLLISIKMNFD